jgi:hypothetical protein
MLNRLTSLLAGVATDGMGDDVLITVNKSKVKMEAAGEGVYVRVSFPKSAVGEDSKDGFVTITKTVLKSLRMSGDVTTLEKDSKKSNKLLFKSGKMSGFIECLDDDVGISNERPKEKATPKMVEFPMDALASCAAAVNMVPALNQAALDIHVDIKNGGVKAITSDLTRGAVVRMPANTKAELKFGMPAGKLISIINHFDGGAEIGLTKKGVLHVKNKYSYVVHPTSQVEEPDDVEGLIKATRKKPSDVAFSMNVGEAAEAAGHVATVVIGGVSADTRLEITLGATESKMTIRSDGVGKMSYTFPIKRLGKSSKKTKEVLISSKFLAEFLALIGDKKDSCRLDVWTEGLCVIDKQNTQDGEKVTYILPLLES